MNIKNIVVKISNRKHLQEELLMEPNVILFLFFKTELVLNKIPLSLSATNEKTTSI